MNLIINFTLEEPVQLIMALIVGGVIGLERELSNKAAGFRTMILICVGSTLFTIMSLKLGANGSQDRIAANIVTGIGFLGAGVVFKDGFNVKGLTTAATIWVTAALGMSIGSQDYKLALEGAVITIMVLFLFDYIQKIINRQHQRRAYIIIFQSESSTKEIESKIKALSLTYSKKLETKSNHELQLSLEVTGTKKKIELLNDYLITSKSIKTFESFI
jgi:putative Mg2+ transporter-C (MgtC) family protein